MNDTPTDRETRRDQSERCQDPDLERARQRVIDATRSDYGAASDE